MPPRWIGPVMVALILGGVVLILVVNLNLKGPGSRRPSETNTQATAKDRPEGEQVSAPPSTSTSVQRPAGFREYPIGDEVERNGMRIAAVWLPQVQMAGMPASAAGAEMIHLEADVKATEGNTNGCPKDEFVPYLNVRYRIVPEGKAGSSNPDEPMRDMMPMVARDGWHYGASIAAPNPGRYRLTYRLEPPTQAGRHSDPATGVAPWWEPFEVSFDWDYQKP
ncbi:MAG: iron transporter [Isosphaeraceae bacterium]